MAEMKNRKNWDSRMQYGLCRRSKLARKASGCNSIEGLLQIKKAEDCNSKVKTDTFNLDEMATSAILAFAVIKSHTIKEKVFAIIKNAIVTDTDPFTKKPLGYHGITEPMVKDLIELTATGKIAPKLTPVPKVMFSNREKDLLDAMRALAIRDCKTEPEKDAIVALYKKIRGFPERAEA